IEEIEQAGRQIAEAFVAQRPDRRPFDLGGWIEWNRRHILPVDALRLVAPVLRVAEQQDVVGKNRFARGEIGEAPRHADLVALINAGIALDRLHERAGFALLGRAALAEAAAAQPRPELIYAARRPGEV